jgi:hypothetical protein
MANNFKQVITIYLLSSLFLILPSVVRSQEINWGDMLNYFKVYNVTTQKSTLPVLWGEGIRCLKKGIYEYDHHDMPPTRLESRSVIMFDVEAREKFMTALYMFETKFYDSKGEEIVPPEFDINAGFVDISSPPDTWKPGMRGIGCIILPKERRVEKIKILERSNY